MLEAINARVDKFAEEMLLSYAAPNRNLVVEVLMLDAATIGQLHKKQLAQYVIVLGQYLVTLQYNQNLKGVEYLLLNSTFEHKAQSAQFESSELKDVTTVKAKRSWVITNVPEITEMYNALLTAEAEKMIISNMVASVAELLNAIKKELSNHYTD